MPRTVKIPLSPWERVRVFFAGEVRFEIEVDEVEEMLQENELLRLQLARCRAELAVYNEEG